MSSLPSVAHRLAARKAGFSLDRDVYCSPAMYAVDLDRIWRNAWLFAGHGCEIPEPGNYFTVEIGDDSVIVVRAPDGSVRAHHNTCRHRGSRLVSETRGSVRRFVCPYHNWAYSLDGRLVSALYMGADFDHACYSLHGVHTEVLCDFIFINLAESPDSFEDAREAIAPHLAPYRPENTKVIHRDNYVVKANWKLLVENNRECYHCRVAHPEFMKANYDLGMNEDSREDSRYRSSLARQEAQWQARNLPAEAVSFPGNAWYRVARMPLKDGFVTETVSGRPSAPLLGVLEDEHCGSLRIVTLPNAWMHANCDYIMSSCLTPISPLESHVSVRFLVHADAREDVDYAVDDVIAVWKATSEQDWKLCEMNQLGVLSSAYEPGPYSPDAEAAVERYIMWYQSRILADTALESGNRLEAD